MDMIEKIKILDEMPKEVFGCFTEEEKEAFILMLNDYKNRCKYEEHKHICKNCGEPFIAYKKTDTYYCDRTSPQDNTKTCKQYRGT